MFNFKKVLSSKDAIKAKLQFQSQLLNNHLEIDEEMALIKGRWLGENGKAESAIQIDLTRAYLDAPLTGSIIGSGAYLAGQLTATHAFFGLVTLVNPIFTAVAIAGFGLAATVAITQKATGTNAARRDKDYRPGGCMDVADAIAQVKGEVVADIKASTVA